MRDQMKKTIAVLLSVLLLGGTFTGCGKTEEPVEEEVDHIDVNATLSGQTLTAGAAADDVFSLAVEYNKGLNPITTKSSLNQMVSGLVYDQLFEVDDNYNLSSRILEDWYFSDNGTLVLELRDDIAMHDGSMLTAEDADKAEKKPAKKTAAKKPAAKKSAAKTTAKKTTAKKKAE